MYTQQAQSDRFRKQLSDTLKKETHRSRVITILKNADVYQTGDPDDTVYFIEQGQVKLLMRSPENKDCLLAIRGTDDIFGESGLSGLGARLETATAMEACSLKEITRSKFFERLGCDAEFLVGFVQHMALQLADQQQVIADMATVDSEQRLGKTLLRLGRSLGKKDPNKTRLELRITHEELSEMVGTTRPRISVFMQRFRKLGLIELNADHFLVIHEQKLTDYLAQTA
jgi:CRP/FNR family transcriptional regulator, cyclic AMP receptor protein